MPSDPLNAKVLIGWMERDTAVAFLMQGCVSDPVLTEDTAEAAWRPFRDRVLDLPARDRNMPVEKKLSKMEREHAGDFLKRVRKFNRDVQRVIKIDPMDLVVYQLFVITDRADDYTTQVSNWKGWKKHCLRPQEPPRQIPSRTEPPNVVVFELPHAEFLPGISQTPTGPQLAIMERPKWVTVTPCDGRMLLWAGYHRSYARMTQEVPATGERAVPVVLVTNLVGPSNTAKVTVATGLRPPLFRDFFDEDFFMMIKLRRKRYELRATFLPGDQISVAPVELFD